MGFLPRQAAQIMQQGAGAVGLRLLSREPDKPVGTCRQFQIGQCCAKRVARAPVQPVQVQARRMQQCLPVGGVAQDERGAACLTRQGGKVPGNRWHGGFVAKQGNPFRRAQRPPRRAHQSHGFKGPGLRRPIGDASAFVQENINIGPARVGIKPTKGIDRAVQRIRPFGLERATVIAHARPDRRTVARRQ